MNKIKYLKAFLFSFVLVLVSILSIKTHNNIQKISNQSDLLKNETNIINKVNLNSKVDQRKYALKLSTGVILFKLKTSIFPNTTNRIDILIREGFYNGLSFFKVLPSYFVQFGDPSTSSFGGSGKKILDEKVLDINAFKIQKGDLCLVRPNGSNSGDSQLIIAINKIENKEHKYLAIGKVISNLEFIKDIKRNDKIIYIKYFQNN